MIFADKLIALRKKEGWSQEELAQQLNVSRQSVSKWEGAYSFRQYAFDVVFRCVMVLLISCVVAIYIHYMIGYESFVVLLKLKMYLILTICHFMVVVELTLKWLLMHLQEGLKIR